jgi:hypothetical protein
MADNYNILEPVTTPSGTTQRSIRALEISSQLYAAAVMHTEGGTAIGHTEDSAHSTADAGVMALAVRRDSPLSSSGTAGDYSSLNVDDRGRLYVRPNGHSYLRLTGAAPTPTGSDITTETGGAITSDMLDIRGTGPATKYFFIPFGVAGYTNLVVSLSAGTTGGSTAFNQSYSAGSWGANSVGLTQEIYQLIGTLAINGGINVNVTLGSFNGATVSYATSPAAISITTANTYRYNVPEYGQPFPYIYFFILRGGTAPASGAAYLDIIRW